LKILSKHDRSDVSFLSKVPSGLIDSISDNLDYEMEEEASIVENIQRMLVVEYEKMCEICFGDSIPHLPLPTSLK